MRAHCAITNSRGDFYISDGVKVIIAVVLGGLLLAAMTLIFNKTIVNTSHVVGQLSRTDWTVPSLELDNCVGEIGHP